MAGDPPRRLPNNDNSQKTPHHHDANTPSSLSSKSPRQPTLTNPLVHFPIQTLFELPNLITDEEATRLIHALDKGHFGKEWTNEGFDRRHRVQRYHYRHGRRRRRRCDSDAGSAATHANENRRSNSANEEEEEQEEEHPPPPPSVEESFGWIFDRMLSACRRDPIDIAANDTDIDYDDDETAKDAATDNEQESRIELPTPMEVIVTEHTPTSCRSQVNVFEQNEYCTCWKNEKRRQHLQKQNEKDGQMGQRQRQQQRQRRWQQLSHRFRFRLGHPTNGPQRSVHARIDRRSLRRHRHRSGGRGNLSLVFPHESDRRAERGRCRRRRFGCRFGTNGTSGGRQEL
mmetsp:Transcript_29421/g.59354  ORF Transcript_29421/g.59354 Transcript_29421/m.59354 type:complete len:343 (-) Transcript_29421:27-1055(-)